MKIDIKQAESYAHMMALLDHNKFWRGSKVFPSLKKLLAYVRDNPWYQKHDYQVWMFTQTKRTKYALIW